MKHPRDSLAGAAWGKLFPALSPKSWLSDSGRLWGALLDGLGRRRGPELIIQPSRCKPPALLEGGSVLVRTGPGWEEPDVLFQMHLPQIPVRAQDQRRASTAFSAPERGETRHSRPG